MANDFLFAAVFAVRIMTGLFYQGNSWESLRGFID
jgi:hypothetical protein